MSTPTQNYELPPDKEAALRRAKRTEWAALFFLGTIILVVGLAMGSSQTMKAMWIEDTVSLIPSSAFLLGAYFRSRTPNAAFPYGYRRAVLVAYLAGSVALFGFGMWILGDSIYKLVTREHPSIQTVEIFGHRIWLGWLMIAALIYSVIPPFILGRIKHRLALELSDKALETSGRIDKGDWLAGLAAVAGILGIAYGYWWADAVAAAFISFEIVKDGFSSLRNSVEQLMNKRPTKVDTKEKDPIVDKIRDVLAGLAWVEKAQVRLREDGDVLTGEAFVVPREQSDLLDKLEEASKLVHSLDWRLHEVEIVPVKSLE